MRKLVTVPAVLGLFVAMQSALLGEPGTTKGVIDTLIHDDYSITAKTGVGQKEGPEPRPVKLQGHHNPVRFRNVWVQKLEMQDDFLKLKFGMFIHFNMATYKDVQWVSGYHSPADFNPGGKIDTDAWAGAAVSAGMKYGVLTAKHVAGFCLWDSKYTTYDVMNP